MAAIGPPVRSTYANFGWAITPQPSLIPIDRSTIWVYVDTVPAGHPVENNARIDIQTLFGGYRNTNGAWAILSGHYER